MDTDLSEYAITRIYDTNGLPEPLNQELPGIAAGTTTFSESYPPIPPGSPMDSTSVLTYKLKAVDSASNESDEISIVIRPLGSGPPAPTGLAGTATDQAVHLTWTAVTDDDLAGYNVERRIPPGGGWGAINTSPVVLPEFLDVGLVNGTTYQYRVVAVDTSGRVSAPSNVVSLTPVDNVPPSTPTGVKVVAGREADRIVISWQAVLDPDLSTYTVYRATSSGGSGTPITGLTTDEYEDTVTSGTTYYYTVTATDLTGNESSSVGRTRRSAPGLDNRQAYSEQRRIRDRR